MKKNNTTTAPEGIQDKCNGHTPGDNLPVFHPGAPVPIPSEEFIKTACENYHPLKAENEKLKEDVKKLAEGYNKYFNKYHELSQENKKLKEDKRELLKKIYHEIDIHCISETENVSMTTIRKILVQHGAIESELY